jgi:Purple acid Phosphatase, N-terminal domain
VKKLFLVAVVFAATAGGLSMPNRLVADDHSPINARAERVRITGGPDLEKASDSWAIIRWTTNNVRGTSLRYGVVHYGTDPHQLSQTAKSPNRWNGALSSMIYRVQMSHLTPGTIYYYRVESVDATDTAEGSESAVNQFTTEQSP